ncbi:MAG TPA: tRNA (uridine(34)/cytosine(34)/5-carboxymethylaminomethyluridine(34)-2'-O)-methyltransferase TrmL [Clostridia bacterium]|nr:tRNA (uridine(34)/cytosine(34)/5-carboxymethylaminomethyluridine(34)-2'-O)-methyltransferase TrmL [Clostridia bacterium]
MNIVLVEPEIPQNTGNIVRTAAATGSRVHLIEPLGFDISDRALKRAGLDYWHFVDITVYKNLEEFFEKNAGGKFYFASTKAQKRYDEIEFTQDCYVLFGKETKGLPEELLNENYENAFRIPMIADARSLNLSNSVAIVVYEAMRQQNFENLMTAGHLTKY